jgi:SAM-dependent methyltransferase
LLESQTKAEATATIVSVPQTAEISWLGKRREPSGAAPSHGRRSGGGCVYLTVHRQTSASLGLVEDDHDGANHWLPRHEKLAIVTATAPDGFPVPPVQLIRRAGAALDGDVVGEYLAGAAGMQSMLMSLLAEHSGRGVARSPRILDFGCGAGNVIRHFAREARSGEVWGADIDAASIAWLQHNLGEPFRFCALSATPRLTLPADHFDLVYAISVFTHLADDWAAWLLELHRVLAPGGIFVATFLGEGMAEAERAAPWDPDRVGMNVLRLGQDWDGGGPTVFMSDWWLRAHWGRAFEILDIHHDRDPSGAVIPRTHGYVVVRKRSGIFAPSDLTAPEESEPRETAALLHNIEQLHADDRNLREMLNEARGRGDTEHLWRVAAQARVAELETMFARSRSWRLISAARRIRHRVRRGLTRARTLTRAARGR